MILTVGAVFALLYISTGHHYDGFLSIAIVLIMLGIVKCAANYL